MSSNDSVAEQRGYAVKTVRDAKDIAETYLKALNLENAIAFGLPEVDDRYHVWRVPLLNALARSYGLGEVVIDANAGAVVAEKSTAEEVLIARLLRRTAETSATAQVSGEGAQRSRKRAVELSAQPNTIALGDSAEILQALPAGCADLVFTSPPYYNARVEYSDYADYDEYLAKIAQVIAGCHRVLSEGRFMVMNVSPVLIRRRRRSESSRRIAVPFDMHRLFIEAGFDFMEDIVWMKPEGAGWATGRGRRFAADRNPLQYKTVPVTENVLVYRKRTRRLIDWHIRSHPQPELVEASKIADGYERTNVWRITPARDRRHPAIFPVELAEKVISYYSFKDDVVLDPFAGIGTTGRAAHRTGRRFVLIERNPEYMAHIRADVTEWLGNRCEDVLAINGEPLKQGDNLLHF